MQNLHLYIYVITMISLLGCGTQSREVVTAHSLRAEAIKLVQEGKTDEALDAFSAAIEQDSEDYISLSNRAQVLSMNGNDEDAIVDCMRASELNSEYAPAFINCGFSLAKTGRFSEAVEYLDRAESLEPDNVAIYINRGGAFVDGEKYEQAVVDFDKALLIEPDNYDALLLRATTLIELNQLHPAIDDLAKAITINPDDVINYRLKSLLHKQLDEFSSAKQELQKALDLELDAETKSEIEDELDEIEKLSSTQKISPINSATSNEDVCDWFLETQVIRSERLSGITPFIEWFQLYGVEGFVSTDKETIFELVEALKAHQPHQEAFLDQWVKLGTHPEAEEFWETELTAVQTRAEAFKLMIDALENEEMSDYGRGVLLFDEASKVGHASESAMLKLRSDCIDRN